MNPLDNEDKKLLELYAQCKYDTAMELGGRTITTQSLLEAQSRISYQEGVEAERKRASEIVKACWYKEYQNEEDKKNFLVYKILTPPTNEKT